jgi:predicted TIM-barrel fold metal-dependent hydrolase
MGRLQEVTPRPRRGGQPVTGRLPGGDLDALVESMDAAGVDQTVIGVGAHQPWLPELKAAVHLATMCNDDYAGAVSDSKGRLLALGCIPLPYVDRAIAEAERCLSELGFLGLAFGTRVLDDPLDSPQFEPLWGALNDLSAVVQVHPVPPLPGEQEPFGLAVAVRGPQQVCVACARLALSGVWSRHPRITFVATCLGGGIPFFFQRINQFFSAPPVDTGETNAELDSVAALTSLYYDTENGNAAALRCTCDVVGADRVVFGTNFPFSDLKQDVDYIKSSGLPEETVEAVLSENAKTLFSLKG